MAHNIVHALRPTKGDAMSSWLAHLVSLPFAPPALPVEEFDDGAEHVVRIELPDLDATRRVRVAAVRQGCDRRV